jgi:hypothetical protein
MIELHKSHDCLRLGPVLASWFEYQSLSTAADRRPRGAPGASRCSGFPPREGATAQVPPARFGLRLLPMAASYSRLQSPNLPPPEAIC